MNVFLEVPDDVIKNSLSLYFKYVQLERILETVGLDPEAITEAVNLLLPLEDQLSEIGAQFASLSTVSVDYNELIDILQNSQVLASECMPFIL